MKKLYLVTISTDGAMPSYYEFHVVALHETEASEKAQSEYNRWDYFTGKVISVKLLSEQHKHAHTKITLLP